VVGPEDQTVDAGSAVSSRRERRRTSPGRARARWRRSGRRRACCRSSYNSPSSVGWTRETSAWAAR